MMAGAQGHGAGPWQGWNADPACWAGCPTSDHGGGLCAVLLSEQSKIQNVSEVRFQLPSRC